MRLAPLSTPRSGNTWLRHLLASVYGVREFATHNPVDLDWPALPDGCVVQVHWHRTPSFLARLDEHRFRVVALARHPLDVLLSILHFALHDSSTARWLEGEDGNERAIQGAMPCSTAFLDYAVGPRAAALLAVSREWWHAPDSLPVRYEDLVADPEQELRRLMDTLGGTPCRPLGEIVAETSLPRMRRLKQADHHFWQGRPGLWKTLLPATEARQIATVHETTLATLGYACDPDASLDRSRADAQWLKLAWSDLTEGLHSLRVLKQQLGDTQAQLTAARQAGEALQARQATTEQARAALATELQGTRQELVGVMADLDATRQRLAPFEDLGPLALGVARRLRQLSLRHPRTATLVKRLVRLADRSAGDTAEPGLGRLDIDPSLA